MFTETLFPGGMKCKGICFHFILKRKFWNKYILLSVVHADKPFMVQHGPGQSSCSAEGGALDQVHLWGSMGQDSPPAVLRTGH